MSHARRTIDRRRRVLYSTQQADLTSSTAASRRTAEQWREARRPTATYAARVHRRLRGRWFSLVPVKRRTLITVATMLWGVALLLSAAHYASVVWPSIVNHPEIARPLRLDRPDSFGRWIMCVLLAGSAGASLLIYQVRRYRVDDYTGQYRLWRLVLIVMFVASINSLVSIVDWTGAVLDLAVGKRVALSGSDWFSIVIAIGGAVLALRLIAEVRRSRWSLVTMMIAWSFMAIPVAAKWNIFAVDSLAKWSLVTTAPLLACTTLFISLGGYLRQLYRQVRNLDENDSLAERFQEWKGRYLSRDRDADVDEEGETGAESNVAAVSKPTPKSTPKTKHRPSAKPQRENAKDDADSDEDGDSADQGAGKRRWWSLRRGKKNNAAATDETRADEAAAEVEKMAEDADSKTESEPRKKRRWLGLRAAKAERTDSGEEDLEDASPSNESSDEDAADEDSPKKRGRFSFGLGRRNKSESQQDEEIASEAASADDQAGGDQAAGDQTGGENDPPVKKRGLGGWLNRGAKASQETAADDDDDGGDDDSQGGNASGDQNWEDPDSIDWDSLSKTERRKLRKQLKRQGRAA